MNKILNINLGGLPFTIDDDAFEALDKYMSTIKRHFAKSSECEEIIQDIEARVAELFMEHLKGQPIISMKEVNKVIEIMGRPEEFIGDHDEEHDHNHQAQADAKSNFKTGKRLFRDAENGKLGGVCAGLSAYFGIEDPVWLRLAFIISVFTGFGVLLYILLWIAIPESKTAADRLAMKGEKINVQNIAKMVEEEVSKLSDTINEITKDFGSKKKA
jgi:phage shock protein PspC (stress-responsive transcriptional regulator)